MKPYAKPELAISSVSEPLKNIRNLLSNQHVSGIEQFSRRHGREFDLHLDPRSGVPTNVIGHIPLFPGSGKNNQLTPKHLEAALSETITEVDANIVAKRMKIFIKDNRDILNLDDAQIGEVHAEKVADHKWQVQVSQEVNGVKVRHARLAATISHGNLVLFGTEGWGDVHVTTKPKITADEALTLGFRQAEGRLPEDQLLAQPVLEIVPVTPLHLQDGDRYVGPVGKGYDHLLVWTFPFKRPPGSATWEVMIDAHSGEVVAVRDTNQYLVSSITGGVYPLTSTEVCPANTCCGTMQAAQPMPFADTGQLAPDNFTTSAGLFDYNSGSVLTKLSGRYVQIKDGCGALSESVFGSNGLNLGGTNGDHDCVTGGSSAGNTAAARSVFYEVNRMQEMARGYLPTNVWLHNPLTANVNINDTCNAYWDGTINFYKSGDGCRNTGELAAVFDHEWGHGLDYNDGNGYSSPSESYADIAASYRLQASCQGYGFFATQNQGCGLTTDGTGYNTDMSQTGTSHCALDCSGVREIDWDKLASHAPDTPANFVCVKCGVDGYGYNGPCGRQAHCESAVDTQAAWDFVARDLQAPPYNYDANTAFIVANRIFYASVANIGNWHTCSCAGSTSNGCGATNAYMQWLAADDDNGDINDGTPHMTALYNAFNRHGIACDTPVPVSSGCAGAPVDAPTLNATGSFRRADLSWSADPLANQYWVYRTEGYAGCDFGKTRIATVTGATVYADIGLANDRQYCYSIMPVGAVDACFGRASACVCTTPVQGPHGTLRGRVTDSATGAAISGATVTASGGYSAATDSSGDYQFTELPVGTFSVTATAYGHYQQTISGVVISDGAIVEQNAVLSSLPVVTVSGTVTDGSGHGWPLYAKIAVTTTGFARTLHTDPLSGSYSIDLYAGIPYLFTVEVPGYQPTARSITPQAGAPENFSVTVDVATCSAPGYGSVYYNERFEIDNGGFTVSGYHPGWTMSWTWRPTAQGVDPVSAHSGTHVWSNLDTRSVPFSYGNLINDYLNSPVLDLSANVGQTTTLSWWQWLQMSDEDYAAVEVSNNGGSSWSVIYGPVFGAVDSAWTQHSVLLGPEYSVSDVRVRFHFFSNQLYQARGWYLDDVSVHQSNCQLQQGGLLVGNVYKTATGEGFNTAVVSADASHRAVAAATPDDPAVADGYFTLFLPAGSIAVTAASAGFVHDEKTVGIVAGTVTRQNFSLTTCSYAVSPSTVFFDSAGSSGSILVTTGNGCTWTVGNIPPWVTVTSGSSGIGSGTVTFTVVSNPAIYPRKAIMTVAGFDLELFQAGAPHGTLQGTVRSSVNDTPLSGATVMVSGGDTTTTNGAGSYQLDVPAGEQSATISAFGHQTVTVGGLMVTSNTMTTRDFTLQAEPTVAMVRVAVLDGSGHGWPLHARIDITGPGYTNTVYTQPLSGTYYIPLHQDTPYTLTVSSTGYSAVSRNVTPAAGGSSETFTLTVDTAACSAPGYFSYFEVFESTDGTYAASGANSSWQWGIPTSGPGSAHSGAKVWATNLSGPYNSLENSYITSPDINLSSNAGRAPKLSWWQWLRSRSTYGDNASIEVSKDGGVTWTTIYGPVTGDIDLTWTRHSILLDPSYSVANFRVRFHFTSVYVASSYPGWYVDDVLVEYDNCQKQPGGLVVGTVIDANSGSGFPDATVTDSGGRMTATTVTPGDPTQGDGFYTLFLPAGAANLTASRAGYLSETKVVNVAADTVAMQGFSLIRNGVLEGIVIDSATGNPISGAMVTVSGGYTSLTDNAGHYLFASMTAGTHDLTVSLYGYDPLTITGIEIHTEMTTRQDVVLAMSPIVPVQGRVVDNSGHGWPLYARIDITSQGYTNTIYTDPATGNFSINLNLGTPYLFTVTASVYDSTTRNVTPSAGGTREDFALTVTFCTAPGYGDGNRLHFSTFESDSGGFTASGTTSWEWGIPARAPGNAHSGTKVWATSLAGNHGNGDGYITSAPIDLSSNAGQPSILSWWQWLKGDYYVASSGNVYYDSAAVEVSNDGGATWAAVYGPVSRTAELSWTKHSIVLDPKYSVNTFRVRFHFYSHDLFFATGYGWFVDDVTIQAKNSCQPLPGGLAVGNAYHAVTGAGVNGATITDGAGHTVTTVATPSDPQLADGFYSMFLPSGNVTLTAASPGYGDLQTIIVPADGSARRDFSLSACTSTAHALIPTSASYNGAGGSGSIQLTGGSCPWTAASNADWIILTSPNTGMDIGTVNYSVQPNPGTAARTGTMTIAGVTFTVTQDWSRGTLQGIVRDAATGNPLNGATVTASGGYVATTDSAGNFQIVDLLAGVHDVTARKVGYLAETVSGLTIVDGAATTLDFALNVAPPVAVGGTVTDGSGHGWPLYAAITITGSNVSKTVYTDPETGSYSVQLIPEDQYSFTVSVVGYTSVTRIITPPSGGSSENFTVTVAGSCDAPGYAGSEYTETFDNNNGAFTVSGTTTWAWGTPTSGPQGGHSGTKVWGTNLSGNYLNNENGYLTSPVLDLSRGAGLSTTLSWWQWLKTETNYDYARVEVSRNGEPWVVVYGPISGTVNTSWTKQSVTLDPSYSVANFRVRFRFTSDGSAVFPGWYIDDVSAQSLNCNILSGGLVIGNVYDSAAPGGISGGTVAAGAGHTTTTTATPDDTNLDDGYYSLFLPAGTTMLTTSYPGYVNGSASVDVTANAVIRKNLNVAACSYGLDPVVISAEGGSGSMLISTGAGCSWNVTNLPPWLTLTSSSSGTGSGTITYSAQPNPAETSRSATVTVAGQPLTLTQEGSATLNVVVEPSNGGVVVGKGINCPGICSTNLGINAVENLTALAHNGYQFSSWTSCDTPAGESCGMEMSVSRNVTANFTICATGGVRRGSVAPAYFATLQEAFNAEMDGNIDCQGVVYNENPVFNVNREVTIRGGYDCSYTFNSRATVIQGSLTISSGSVSVENLVIQ